MIKLSQRAWNNVIIVSMLSLIALFNFSANLLNGESDDVSSFKKLVPADMLISTIEFENGKVERVGRGWRIASATHSKKTPEDIVAQWQRAELSLFEQNLPWAASLPKVRLWLIGQAQPIEYQFVQLVDKTLVKVDKQTYQLTNTSYSMLIL